MQIQPQQTLTLLLEEIMIPSSNQIINDRFNSNESDSISGCSGTCDSGSCKAF